MKVSFILSDEFIRQFKRLAKKYSSLLNDYDIFKEELRKNPFQGNDMGNGVRKVRMTITSKGKGKSGGARVITLNVTQLEDDTIEITLLTIYDKSEISNVTDKYIKWLISLINK
ncbi:MAG: addiction module toxin RelE [Bacteroidaceae bacterium]|nr:addiction module toxin RelE [Bacteroidaceae bacterium]